MKTVAALLAVSALALAQDTAPATATATAPASTTAIAILNPGATCSGDVACLASIQKSAGWDAAAATFLVTASQPAFLTGHETFHPSPLPTGDQTKGPAFASYFEGQVSNLPSTERAYASQFLAAALSLQDNANGTNATSLLSSVTASVTAGSATQSIASHAGAPKQTGAALFAVAGVAAGIAGMIL